MMDVDSMLKTLSHQTRREGGREREEEGRKREGRGREEERGKWKRVKRDRQEDRDS